MRDRYEEVRAAFDRDALAEICILPEAEFATRFDMLTAEVEQPAPDNFFHYRDGGSEILAVAHLDTVVYPQDRHASFAETAGGLVVHSGALDDRLGAYILLDLLPKLGVQFDVLLTTGEESGRSTAGFFAPPKDYLWGIEFDRGGTDVVMYQYEDDLTTNLVRACGARVGDGSFSDISYLEHVGVKMFNWGVGYQDYHGPRSHAYLEDTFDMVAKFLTFHEANSETFLPHVQSERPSYWGYSAGAFDVHGPDDGEFWCAVHEEWAEDEDEGCINCVIEADHRLWASDGGEFSNNGGVR